MLDDKAGRKLRKKLEKALNKGRDEEALDCIEQIEHIDVKAPRWPHKRGDMLRKAGRKPEAISAYEKAVGLYADQGFLARAVAMARTILDLDEKRIDILEKVDPQAARLLHQQRRAKQQEQQQQQQQAKQQSQQEAQQEAPAPPGIAAAEAAPKKKSATTKPKRQRPAVQPPPPQPSGEVSVRRAPRPPARPSPPTPSAQASPPSPPKQARRARAPEPRPVTLSKLSLPPGPGAAASDFGKQNEDSGAARVAEIYSQALGNASELVEEQGGGSETRFSNAPPAEASIERDIRENQWAAPQSQPTPDVLGDLPLFPLFADISSAALAHMIRGSQVIDVAVGGALVKRGEPGNALYGIVSGTVEVVVHGRPTPLLLGEGEIFGESCLLADETRSSDVVARSPVTALRIPRDVLLTLVEEHPELAEVLLRMLVRRLLGNLLQASPLFQGLDGGGRAAIARLFETRRAAAGTVLAESGKRMDGLYITLTGTVEAGKRGEEPKILGAGTMFGQQALLTQKPSTLNIRTRVNLVVLRLPANAFMMASMEYPLVLEKISELATSEVVNIRT